MGAERLVHLLDALDFRAEDQRRATAIFESLAVPWGARLIHRRARFASDITDDHTPFEMSVAVERGRPEVRFLIEAQGASPTIRSNWSAALDATARLAAEHGVSLERLRRVQELFAPTGATRRFAAWHAVCFTPGGAPDFKIYLNPQARGETKARALVAQAFERLGLAHAIAHLPVTDALNRICYLSLDLADRRSARVKVYTAHDRATPARIEAAVASARGTVRGAASEFCRAMAASNGPYVRRPVITCLSFVGGDDDHPQTATAHFPVRSYARDDAVVLQRVSRFLDRDDRQLYRRAVQTFANRKLADGIGMQTYASLRLVPEGRRLTVYLAPEIYDVRRG